MTKLFDYCFGFYIFQSMISTNEKSKPSVVTIEPEKMNGNVESVAKLSDIVKNNIPEVATAKLSDIVKGTNKVTISSPTPSHLNKDTNEKPPSQRTVHKGSFGKVRPSHLSNGAGSPADITTKGHPKHGAKTTNLSSKSAVDTTATLKAPAKPEPAVAAAVSDPSSEGDTKHSPGSQCGSPGVSGHTANLQFKVKLSSLD